MKAVFLISNKKEIQEIIKRLTLVDSNFQSGIIEFDGEKTKIIAAPVTVERQHNGKNGKKANYMKRIYPMEVMNTRNLP